jgi:hypothetical protein
MLQSPLADELREQAKTVRVESLCGCGCPSVQLVVDPAAPRARYTSADESTVGVVHIFASQTKSRGETKSSSTSSKAGSTSSRSGAASTGCARALIPPVLSSGPRTTRGRRWPVFGTYRRVARRRVPMGRGPALAQRIHLGSIVVLIAGVLGFGVAAVSGSASTASTQSPVSVIDRTYACATDLVGGLRKIEARAHSGSRAGSAWTRLPYAVVASGGVARTPFTMPRPRTHSRG